MKDRTSIIIAHRLSTVRNADHILVLNRGRIVERLGDPSAPRAVSLIAIHQHGIPDHFPEALRGRIEDCESNVVITADEGVRGGKKIPLKANVDAALTGGHYLTGPYNAVGQGGQADDAHTSIGYDARTGQLWVDPPQGVDLTVGQLSIYRHFDHLAAVAAGRQDQQH